MHRALEMHGSEAHIDAIDNGIPVVCILTSASVHDRNPVG